MLHSVNDKRIEFVVHEKNKGACVARNTGAKLAHGEFLAFLDDDDEWIPTKSEEQVKYMSGPQVGIVSRDMIKVNEGGKNRVISHRRPQRYGTELEDLMEGNYI